MANTMDDTLAVFLQLEPFRLMVLSMQTVQVVHKID